MKKNLIVLFFICAAAFGQNNSRYVNVFIGTDGTGHTFPGPSLPFGMVQPGPDNRDIGWSYTSGYQFRDTTVLGFSQTRFNGTGISEMGDILLLPFSEEKEKYKNSYYKDSEKASVGYYSIIKKDDVKVELTCSERVAYHRYTFPTAKGKLFVNFQHGLRFLTDSLVLDSEIKIENNQTITGYCHTKNWVERKYFFIIKYELPFQNIEKLPLEKSDKAPKYIFTFMLGRNRVLNVKVALSTVSIQGANNNMRTEIPGWNFEKVKLYAERTWNRYLNKIEIEAPIKQKENFYTSLYRFLLQPSNIADVNGLYRGADDYISKAPNNEYYSTLSIWDIYRGAFPLLQIIAPERVNGIINTLLLHHKAAGFLPIWTAWGQDNYCMIGNHSIPMILSAFNNGFNGFDKLYALKAIYETSTKGHINSDWELYNQFGYYPIDKLDNEAVSRTLESGYDDWCVAEMAFKLGNAKTANIFYKRANYYNNLFDSDTKMFRGKDTKGKWRTPFDPLMATSPMNNAGDYTEANAWQYFWTPAQYDVDGIIKLLGGKTNFTKQLNDFFTIAPKNPDKFLGQEAMIGQYAHGNEPSHHIIYLYAFSNNPERGQAYIHKVISDFYNNTPDGMIGNDDCGQMSAWYILSTFGFYPVNSASGEFVFGSPQVKKAKINFKNGKKLLIIAQDLSKDNIYIKTRYLNGKSITASFITYKDIMKGGVLKYMMENK